MNIKTSKPLMLESLRDEWIASTPDNAIKCAEELSNLKHFAGSKTEFIVIWCGDLHEYLKGDATTLRKIKRLPADSVGGLTTEERKSLSILTKYGY